MVSLVLSDSQKFISYHLPSPRESHVFLTSSPRSWDSEEILSYHLYLFRVLRSSSLITLFPLPKPQLSLPFPSPCVASSHDLPPISSVSHSSLSPALPPFFSSLVCRQPSLVNAALPRYFLPPLAGPLRRPSSPVSAAPPRSSEPLLLACLCRPSRPLCTSSQLIIMQHSAVRHLG